MTKIPFIIIRLLIALASVTISLQLADFIFYFISPYRDLPLNGRRNGTLYTWGHPVRKNSFGVRGVEPAIPKPTGTFRVMALGDSLTWGAGVAEEQRYTEVATRRLKEQSLPIEIINLGLSGSPLTGYRDLLFKVGEQLQPDLITIGFCFNDPQPKEQNYSPERQAYIARNRGLLKKSLRVQNYYPYLGNALFDGVLKTGEKFGHFPSWPEALDRIYNPESLQWQEFERALLDIFNWSSAHGLKTPIFLVLNQGSSTVNPTFFSKPDPLLTQFISWWDQAAKAATEIGFIVQDHQGEFLAKLDGKVLGINRADGHPSVAEHRIYGEKLAETISRLYLND